VKQPLDENPKDRPEGEKAETCTRRRGCLAKVNKTPRSLPLAITTAKLLRVSQNIVRTVLGKLVQQGARRDRARLGR
jgi:hypothetical protein